MKHTYEIVSRCFFTLTLGAVLLFTQSTRADVTKANNSTVLTNGASWTGGVVPGATDVAIFTNTLHLNTNDNTATPVSLGGNLSVLGIRVAGPVLGQAATENGIVISNDLSAETLTIGTSGIDMSAPTAVPLEIQSQITLSGSQTWNITNASSNITTPAPTLPLPATQTVGDQYCDFSVNDDEDLCFFAQAAGAAFNLGGFTLTLTNTGTTVIDAGYTVDNGTINVNQGTLIIQGGKSRQTTINGNVSINVATNATLCLLTTSGEIVSSAAISLASGSLLDLIAAGTEGAGVVSNSIAVSGSATISQTQSPIVGGNNDITNDIVADLTGAAGTTLNLQPSQSGTAVCVLELSGTNSGFDGTIDLDATNGIRPVRLGGAAAGSANATWTIGTSNVLEVAGVSVQLGSLNGSGIISNITAATTATINVGAGSFSGIITNSGTAVMALTKITAGTLTLSNSDTYNSTVVSNGTLLAYGSLGSPVTIYSGGTVGGTGTIRSNLLANAGATVAPGSTSVIGTLAVSGTVTNNGGGFLLKIDRTNSPTSDELTSAKTLAVTGGGTITVTNVGPALQAGDTFTVLSATGYSGSFSSPTLPALGANLAWNTANLTVNGTISVVALPVITNDLTSQSVVLSNTATFTVGASGTAPLAYQWRFNTTNVLVDATNTLVITNAQTTNAGTYAVIVTNAYGAVTSSVVTLTVHIPAFITNPPTAQSVVLSNNATFTVGAGGDAPLAYQWYFNSTNLLTGANTNTLVITDAQTTNGGNYSVVVTNAYGSVTSAAVALTVNIPAFITNSPASQSVQIGNNVTFTVGAGGTAPLAYQWWFNTTNLLVDATNALVITNAQTTNAGTYLVIVTNNYGAATSTIASLTVTQINTSLALSSSSQTNGYKGGVNFTAMVQTNGVTATNATGSVQFQTNGTLFGTIPVSSGSATSLVITNLPRGTNLITAIYSGDSNYQPNTNSINQIVTNHPPVAANATYYRAKGVLLLISIANLLTNATDVDGDTLTLAGVGTDGYNLTTATGSTLTTNATYVFYTNSTPVDESDSFEYVVSDGYGGLATNTVSVQEVAGQTGQTNAPVVLTGTSATLTFFGVSGYQYDVQRTTNLTVPVIWVDLGIQTAPPTGIFQVTDSFSDLGGVVPAQAYWQIVYTNPPSP